MIKADNIEYLGKIRFKKILSMIFVLKMWWQNSKNMTIRFFFFVPVPNRIGDGYNSLFRNFLWWFCFYYFTQQSLVLKPPQGNTCSRPFSGRYDTIQTYVYEHSNIQPLVYPYQARFQTGSLFKRLHIWRHTRTRDLQNLLVSDLLRSMVVWF